MFTHLNDWRNLMCGKLSERILEGSILAWGFCFSAIAQAQENEHSDRVQQEQQAVREIEAFRKANEENYRLSYIVKQIIHISYREELLRDLEIVGYQKGKLVEISDRYQKEFQKLSFQFAPQPTADGEPPVFNAQSVMDMETKHFELLKTAMMGIESVLLPHQISRMKQIAELELANVNSKYLGKLGVPLALSPSCGLSLEQMAKLKEVTDKANAEFKAELETLHLKYYQKIISSLSPEQQELLEKKIGRPSDNSFHN